VELLGVKWPVIQPESSDFHAFFYMPKICDMGPTALLPLRKEGVLRNFFFRPEKSDDFGRV
jgi:hypothetical protein